MLGVSDVNVLVDSKQVIVLFNPQKVTLDQITETMDREGYPVEAYESGPVRS